MEISEKKLEKALVGAGHISKKDFTEAQKTAKKKGLGITEVLSQKDLIKDTDAGLVLSDLVGFPFVKISEESIDDEVFSLIPEVVAKANGVVAYARVMDGTKVAMIDPTNLEKRHILEKRVGTKVLPHLTTKRELEEVFSRYKADIKTEFAKLFKELQNKNISQEKRDEITIKMVDTLISYGYQNKASDIHVEPYREKVVVRFRIDGVMHDVLEINKDLLEIVLTRIKIMSRMRTDEHRDAQDGKFRFKASSEEIDVRVSIVPIVTGENVVMRLLSSVSRRFSLRDLGLGEKDFSKVEAAIENPHGMVLVTGPTGSGKTTTVYAVLKILNKREVHVSTIEDPVEYDIEGISQIQIDKRTDLTFAKGLRAIVRQDPDIIMVGEIRDEETADIAVNSAMTGHLVLSTLHANDSSTTLPRLLDMKVEPFLVASTVNVVIAQRLVRVICSSCRASTTLNDEQKKLISYDKTVEEILKKKSGGKLDKLLVYHATGCEACGNTGYSGRVGIFEVLPMSDEIKDLIIKRASSDELEVKAKELGMTTMVEDGIEKILSGITTIEEVLRVTKG
jgi:type IV pilus assembly protein PilB